MIRVATFLVINILMLDGMLAQNTAGKTVYWQQRADYKIEVSLNDKKHQLDAFLTLNYTNYSPDELTFIYFHLWPNAYKDQSTALAKQKLENGQTDFYYSRSYERGSIDGLNFKSGEKVLKWDYDSQHPDICKVNLSMPLKTGESITISTPFTVQIPESFSRLGHVGQSYQITQWYPKPAVYDANGWHPMPYLDQGEFYSEFGNFDVSITLPKNYVVGATGNLQNEEELAWLNQKAAATDEIKEFSFDTEFPPSDSELKTLRYVQDNVHDFAWFADKRFHVRKGSVKLPASGKEVKTWAMFTNEEADMWKNSIDYLNESVLFFSKLVGEYPYDQVTAVESALSAGAGMEYPTITVIGGETSEQELETVIVHEVGHNWFYGILGSNERAHPWMDEGFTSYYEERYFREKYPENKMVGAFARNRLAGFFDIDHYPPEALSYFGYLSEARTGSDQAISSASEDLTYLNYWAIAYGKAAMVFRYLENYLGTAQFDNIMRQYYTQLAFKHPQPEDVKDVFEKESGKKLDWFFDELLPTTKKLDYKVSGMETVGEQVKITIQNKGEIAAPFAISALKSGKIVHTKWYEGQEGESVVDFPKADYEVVKIDAEGVMPEVNRDNNTLKVKGFAKKMEPLRLQLFGSLENPEKSQVFFSPIGGFNKYDGAMLGLAFYNSLIPRRKFEYALAPMYAFKSGSFSGMGELAYNIYPGSKAIHHIQLKLSGQTFALEKLGVFDVNGEPGNNLVREDFIKYYRFSPELTVTLRKKHPRSPIDKSIRLRHVNISKDQHQCDEELYNCESFFLTDNDYINEATFNFQNSRRINPFGFEIGVQQGQDFVLSTLEANWKFSYKGGKNKGFDIRLFAGGFLQNNTSGGSIKFLTMSDGGAFDYLMDDLYFGRNELNGFYGQQIAHRHGAFKIPTSIGRTSDWLVAINLQSDLPIPVVPVKLYADFGTYANAKDAFPGAQTVVFNMGVALTPIPGALEIYVPLLLSSDIKRSYDNSNSNFTERISFYLNLSKLNPIKAVRQIQL